MHIELHLPRPGLTLLAAAAVSGWALYFTTGQTQTASVIEAPVIVQAQPQIPVAAVPALPAAPVVSAVVPPMEPVAALPVAPVFIEDEDTSGLTQAEMRIKWARAEQEYLRQKQDIIREQLEGLRQEREALGDVINADLEQQFRRSAELLTSLVKDESKAEQFLLMSYRQQWEAEERAMATATGSPEGKVVVYWPIEPKIGISAYFLDKGYKERFKVEHYAIDIPVPQGTAVLAAADGIVKDVVDHGLGYNYVTIDHGGYATVYGHISTFSVRPGQRLRAGDPIGYSGGMPGLPGGGSSTGPHLHFGVYVKGVPVDPLKYLPEYKAE